MKYFKINYTTDRLEWTEYGCYEDSDITPDGYIETTVYSVECDDGKYSYECYANYLYPDDITEITEEEYRHVVEQLQKVDELQSQIEEVLKVLI